MTKLLIVSINLFALLAYKLFFGGDVSVEQKIPESINAGETFEIEILIEKGDREGFAKWQQALPEGFIAEAKDTKGATFSFKNQEVKLIWMAIPTEESFSISYTVKVDPDIQGQFEINGKFSFIEENERRDINSEVKQLTVGAEVAAGPEALASDEIMDEVMDESMEETMEPAEEIVEVVEDETTEEVEETANEMIKSDGAVESIAYSDEDIVIKRKVMEKEASKYEVILTIEKGSFNSFGKIEEFIPENYTASSIENSDGMFTFKENVMKVLWMTLPSDETLTVKYSMESTSNQSDMAEISGMFSYLDDDESKQVELGSTEFKNTFAPAEAATEEEEIAEVIEEEVAEPEPIMEQEVVEETENETTDLKTAAETLAENEEIDADQEVGLPDFVVNNDGENAETLEEEETVEETVDPIEEQKEDLIQEITNIPAPESNVNYKVQIAAGRKEVNQKYFVDRHNITEEVSIEFHQNWFKYTVGGYGVYKEARDRRNEIWAADNKINDAFVTAYNSGERISVQEALMITKQKWFK